MREQGFSLIETMTSIIIVGLLAVTTGPNLSLALKKQRFNHLVSTVTAHFQMARLYAQHSGAPVYFELFPDGSGYRIAAEEDMRRDLAVAHFGLHFGRDIKPGPLSGGMIHPTVPREITDGLRSSNQDRLYFKLDGSSSGTLVISDGQQQAVCVVVDGSSGHFQVFVWNPATKRWRITHA